LAYVEIRSVAWAVAIAVVAVVGAAYGAELYAQSVQQPGQPYSDWAINVLSSQLAATNQQVEILRTGFARLDNRQAVTETQVNQIIWILGVVAVAIITQVVLALRDAIRKNGGKS
jgi:hypothetical protein